MHLNLRDKKIIWHPLTQHQTVKQHLGIVNGEGTYLIDEDGNRYADLISSWWVNLHGHGNSIIAKAIYEQALKLEHVIFAGFTHEPAIQLCENLQDILPNQLKRFFFSDSGSSATEIALKMAYQFWHNKGQQARKSFIIFAGGYHGDTVGAMSISHSHLHSAFDDLLFPSYYIDFPDTWVDDAAIEEKEAKSLRQLKDILDRDGQKIAAFIVEPLVQGAGGMKICRPAFLEKACLLAKEYGLMIIFDEVMTGFGRTGKIFAMDHINVVPDIICLSKGLTGGFLPMALTIATDEIFEAFLGDTMASAFTHSHSYTANPLGCAAAIASLSILRQPEVQNKIQLITALHQRYINKIKSLSPLITKPRSLGTIAAFDIVSGHISMEEIKNYYLKNNIIVRPIGSTIYVLAPYCIDESVLEQFYNLIPGIMGSDT